MTDSATITVPSASRSAASQPIDGSLTLGTSISSRQNDFSRILARASETVTKTPEETAQQAAREFVAMSLVQPLLKEMRDTNHAAAPFAPTGAEKQFQSMLDAHAAQEIVRARQFSLVDSVARKLLDAQRRTQDASQSNIARSSNEPDTIQASPEPASAD